MPKKPWTNWFVCERSGNTYPISQMVIEPGTGYKVHRKFCDFSYSLNKHPQNYPPKRKLEEANLLPTIRPDTQVDGTDYIVDELYLAILDEKYQPMIYN